MMKLCTRHQAVVFFPPAGIVMTDLQLIAKSLDQSASPWSHSVSIDELLTSHRTKALEEQQ